MRLDDYAREVDALRVYAGRDTEGGLAIAALGLAGETFEYREALTPDELADVAWYWVATVQELGGYLVQMQALAAMLVSTKPNLCDEVGKVVDDVKKLLSKGEYEDIPDFRGRRLVDGLAKILWAIELEATRHGYTLAELADLNLAKLHERRDTTGVLR